MSTVNYLVITTRRLDRISPKKIMKQFSGESVELVYFPGKLDHWSSKYLDAHALRDSLIFRASIEELPLITRTLSGLDYCYGISEICKIKILSKKVLLVEFDTESG